jgi:hypothetical protein
MILCPLCRGAAQPDSHRWPYTVYGCQDCGRRYYLPSHLSLPVAEPVAASVDEMAIRRRQLLWELDDCVTFLLQTCQIGDADCDAYRTWRREEDQSLNAVVGREKKTVL